MVFLLIMEFAHHDVKFTGLIYFCMDEMRAIRTVIDTLRIPSLETRVWNPSTTFCCRNSDGPIGNSPGYVFRPAEHQTTGLVPDVHRREKVNEYVAALLILAVRNSDLLSCDPVYRRTPKEKKEVKEMKDPDTAKQQSTLKVTDQYIALLIRVFVAAGLLDVSWKRVPWNPWMVSDEKAVIRRSHQCVRRVLLGRTFLGRQHCSLLKSFIWETRFCP